MKLRLAAQALILFIMLPVGVYSQLGSNDEGFNALEKCIDLYLELKKFSVDVEYSVFYDKVVFDSPDDRRIGKVIRDGKNFYQREIENVKILNSDYEFSLNGRSKVISLNERTTRELNPVQFEIDSLRGFIEKTVKIPGGYQFYLNSGPVEKFDLILTGSGYMHILRNYYREKLDFGEGSKRVVTQVRYSNFNKGSGINKGVFSLDKYLSIDKAGNIKLKAGYENYHLINNIKRP